MKKLPLILKSILTFTLLLSFSSIHSQTEIKSKIVDFMSMMPIESASIYIQNTTIGTMSNVDGKFVLLVPEEHDADTLVISSIGYKSFKTPVNEFDGTMDVFLEEDVAELDEIVLVAEPRPTTGNEIVLKALQKLEATMPENSYLLKGFLRHKERNKKEFKWLIESAITVYDSGYATNSAEQLKINVDEVRKSYDLREVDSLFAYAAYLTNKSNKRNLRARNLRRDTIRTSTLVNAIKWNDQRVNGLENLLQGKLNLVRNSTASNSLFGEDILTNHQFELDTILVDNERKIYKVKIEGGLDYVDLNTPGIFNNGYQAEGWMYIYYDNYAIKKIEYQLVAASPNQKKRSKDLFGTQTNHKLVINYLEFDGRMYPNYIYYETPKLVNVGAKPSVDMTDEEKEQFNRDERYYYTIQEILFTDVIFDEETIASRLASTWDSDIFSVRPYHKDFWKNYNTLLESEEEEQLIQDLTKRSRLFKD